MTKTQAISKIKEIISMLEDAQSQLDELSEEMQDTIDSIEPYENKEELTPQQEERQEWFFEALDEVESQSNELSEIIGSLDYIE